MLPLKLASYTRLIYILNHEIAFTITTSEHWVEVQTHGFLRNHGTIEIKNWGLLLRSSRKYPRKSLQVINCDLQLPDSFTFSRIVSCPILDRQKESLISWYLEVPISCQCMISVEQRWSLFLSVPFPSCTEN